MQTFETEAPASARQGPVAVVARTFGPVYCGIMIAILVVTSITLAGLNSGNFACKNFNLAQAQGAPAAAPAGAPAASVCSSGYDAATWVMAGSPACNAGCQLVNASDSAARAGLAYALLAGLVGPVRLVRNEAGGMTLLTRSAGAANGLQPLLCNLTQATGAVASIFQYTAQDFQRVVTTVPTATGGFAVCTMLSRTSPAYSFLVAGGQWVGPTTLFGVSYNTIYGAIMDSTGTGLIGALFVGVPA